MLEKTFTKYKTLNIFIVLIFLDILSTIICIAIGGLEYNPISAFFIKQSMVLYILIRLSFLIILYILAETTLMFEKKINIKFIKVGNIYFSIIVILNCIYITLKLFGVI